MKRTKTGVQMLPTDDMDMRCPFHQPQALNWQEDAVQLDARRIPLKIGLDHLSLNLKIDGPLPVQFEFLERTLVLGFVISGWAKLHHTADNVEKLESGQWYQLSSNGLHFDRTSNKGVALEIFLCSGQFAETLGELEQDHGLKALDEFNNKEISDTIDTFSSGMMKSTALSLSQLIAKSSSGSIKERLQLEANALIWIADILSQSANANQVAVAGINANDREAIKKITNAMEQNPSKEFTMDDLCRMGGINEHKLKSAFKYIHGKTTFSYLREVRMDYAAKLLREDRLSVIQVANEVSYSNASHFAKAFKDRHKLLPKAYQCLYRL